MSVSYVSSSSVATSAATSHSCPAPATIADGDLLFASVAADGALTPPAGWTQLYTVSSSSTTMRGYYKVAASESGAYVFTSAGSRTASIIMAAIRGAAATAPVYATGTDNASDVIDAPSVTPTTAADYLLCFFAGESAATPSQSTVTGMTEFKDVPSGVSSHSGDRLLLTSGSATGIKQSTCSATISRSCAASVCITTPVVTPAVYWSDF